MLATPLRAVLRSHLRRGDRASVDHDAPRAGRWTRQATSSIAYPIVFFAILWAWMGFTWFASAYDTDDAGYRETVFVQMVGVLVLAAGIPRFSSTSIRRSASWGT